MEPKPKIPGYKKLTRKERMKKESDYLSITVFISRKTMAILDELSKSKMLPKSRLISYAIENEMESKYPFHLDIPEPDPAVENEYAHEAKLIYEYLKRCPSGMGLDSLIMFRRDIGISDKKRLVGGYRELLNANMIEESWPRLHSFEFNRSYRVAKPITRGR